jgi:hypothetical protein
VLGDVLRVASDPQAARAEYRLAARLHSSTQRGAAEYSLAPRAHVLGDSRLPSMER